MAEGQGSKSEERCTADMASNSCAIVKALAKPDEGGATNESLYIEGSKSVYKWNPAKKFQAVERSDERKKAYDSQDAKGSEEADESKPGAGVRAMES